VGDILTIPSAEGSAKLEVVGILSQITSSVVDEAFVTLPTAQKILGLPGQISTIDILLKGQVDKAKVEQDLLQALDGGFKIGAVEVGNELSAALQMGESIMWLFGIMALAMAAFIIFNTFRTVVAERRRDLGMLRAIGASRKTVMGLILTESLIQGIIGTALGLVLGYLLAYGILQGLAPVVEVFMRTKVGLPAITTQNLTASILLGIGFTVGSSYFPSRTAMKVTPMEALRPVTLAVERKKRLVRALLGFILIVISVIGVIVGELTLASFSALLFLVGLILVIPVLVRPIANTFGKLLALIFVREGNLARGNLNRQPGRAAVTASSMMIGLAVTIAVIGLVTSVFDGFTKYLDKSLGADYLLMPSSLVLAGGNLGSAPEFAQKLEKLDGISGVTTLRLASTQADGAALQVIGIDPAEFPVISGLEFSKGDPQTSFNAMTGERAIIINGIFSASSGVKPGDNMILDTAEGEKTYRVVGIAMDYLNAKLATGYISQANLEKDFHVTTDILIMANRTAQADPAKVDAELRAAAKDYPAFTLFDTQAFKDSQMEVFSSAMGLMYALVIMLAVPGLIAMANTLGISVIERTREIGMLRAVGSTQRQIKQMVFAESLLLSALGTSLGILVGLFMSYYLLKAIILSGFKLDFFFPGLGIVVAIAVGLLFGVLAAMVPARQAAKTVIVEALRYE
jgi:putative ABC transport system permease protein